MSKIDDGGPLGDSVTMLDWYAAHAMVGLLAWSPDQGVSQYSPEQAATHAYQYAAAMLAEKRRLAAGPAGG